jgi:hypothetical protein
MNMINRNLERKSVDITLYLMYKARIVLKNTDIVSQTDYKLSSTEDMKI